MKSNVAQDVIQIDTKPLGCEQIVAAFLVCGSDATALIDPGFPASAEPIAHQMSALGVDPERLDYIVLTHSHIDHAGAVGKLARIAGRAKILAHKRGIFYLKNSAKIGSGARVVFGPELAAKLGEPIDVADERIHPLADGDSIELGDKRLRVYYTPAHSSDHISLFEEITGTLFPGDAACLHYPALGHILIPAASPPIYQADRMVEQLRRLSQLGAKAILTPHFGAPDYKGRSGPAEFLAENIETVTRCRRRVERMFSEGMEFPQVVARLRADILATAGKGRSAPPDFLADVWLPLMLKTGLMGYMADILQYARDIRPFYDNHDGTREHA